MNILIIISCSGEEEDAGEDEYANVAATSTDATASTTNNDRSTPNTLPTHDTLLIPVTIPLYKSKDNIGNNSLLQFCAILGEASMKVYNAVLLKKRVIFVGYNHSAADIGNLYISV